MAEIRVRSEISGSVWRIEVGVGDRVAAEDALILLESMKMEIPLLAPLAGTVKQILVSEGASITEGEVAVVLETAPGLS
ncbi:MAG: acetyl-CoA carboxylase biotin carboxyl carrier protein subunit [Alphaproteobacteria bacterium]|nr:acetyl-CoA carboxylase biotin carboxyl carrier protein subunit [Alphaproteobacteria bacterium]